MVTNRLESHSQKSVEQNKSAETALENARLEVSNPGEQQAQLNADGERRQAQATGLTPVEIKGTDGSSIQVNETGRVSKVVEKDGKTREFGYDGNGKLNSFKDETGNWKSNDGGKTWTNAKGQTRQCQITVTRDGTTTIKESDKVSRFFANGNNRIIEATGRITENGRETQAAFDQDKLNRLGKSVDAIAYACNGGIGIGTDERKIEAELGDKSEAELLVIKRMWRENAAKGKSNYDSPTLKAEMRDELSGSDLDRVVNMLNRQDGKADSAGRIHTALVERGEWFKRGTVCDKDVRDTLSKASARQIAEMGEDYRNRYGISLRDAIMNNKDISPATKQAAEIYLKGNDKRTPEDSRKLADIACRYKNIDMFKESMGLAPQSVRDGFMKDGGEQKLLASFGKLNRQTGMYDETADLRHALDYARSGKVSTARLVRDNSSIFGDNEKAIATALKKMTAEERKTYLDGRQLATGEGAGDTSELTEAEKKKAIDYYKDLHSALDGAANATEMREWEALIKYDGKANLISTMASQKNFVGWHNVDDIVGNIEKIPKEDWERLNKEAKEGKHEYRDEIVKTLGTYLSQNDLKRCTDVLDKKIQAKTFDQSETVGKRDALTSIKDARGWFNNNEENILNAIRTMTKEEQEKYRTDEEYRKEIDRQLILGLDYGKELDAARYMLNQIEQGKSPDDLAAKLHIHAQKLDTDEAQVTREVEDAFRKDPELRRKVTNPQTEEERKLSQELKKALASALGPVDYASYGAPLLKDGVLSAEKRQELNRGVFNDDEIGSYKDLLRASDTERKKILEDKNYADKLLGHLSDDERQVALNNLREYDRIAGDTKIPDEQRQAAMDAMLEGEMRPEDRLRAYMLGWGTNGDGIREILKDLPTEEAHSARADYERKYGSLKADLVDEISGLDLENALDAVRVKGTQEEEFDYYRDHFYYNTHGFGREAVDSLWDGTGFQSDEAFNRYFNAISEANRTDMKLSEEQQRELQDSLKDAAEALKESKADLANTAADVAITAAAFIPGGQAAALLRFGRMATIMGVGGGGMKVMLKAAMLSDAYSAGNAGLDFCAGFTDGALNVVGGGHLGKILKCGETAASKAAVRSMEELTEKGLLKTSGKMAKVVLEDGSENLVSREVLSAARGITGDAIAQGAKQFDDKALKAAARELVNPEVASKATREALARGLTKELAEKEGKAALAGAQEEIANVLQKQLQNNLALETRSLARRFLSDVGANTFNGATGAGASGAISSLAEWDSTRSLEENFSMVLRAAGTSAITGGTVGLGLSSTMKSAFSALENRAVAKAASRVNGPGSAARYNPPISARSPEAPAGSRHLDAHSSRAPRHPEAAQPSSAAPGHPEVAPAGSSPRADRPRDRAYTPVRQRGEKVMVGNQEWQWVHYDNMTGDAIVARAGRDNFVRVDIKLDQQNTRPIKIEGRNYVTDSYGAVWQHKGQGYYSRVFKYQVVPFDKVQSPSPFKEAFNQLFDWGKTRRNMVETGVKPVDMYGEAALVVAGAGLPAIGTRIPLNESSVAIGRGHLGQAFDSANSHVSWDHLSVEWDAKEQLYFIKENSTNGTYVKRAGSSYYKQYKGNDRIYIGPNDSIRLAGMDGPEVRLDLPHAKTYARPSNIPQTIDAQVLAAGKQVNSSYNDVFLLGRDFQDLGKSDALNRQVGHYHGHIIWDPNAQAFEFTDLTSASTKRVGRPGATVMVDQMSSGNGSYLIRDGKEYLIQKDSRYGNKVTLADGDVIRLGSPTGPEVKIVINENGQHYADGRVQFSRADGTVAIKRPDGTIAIDNIMSGKRVEDATGRVLEATDIYGRMQRYRYDEHGRLNTVVSDNGSVLSTKDGLHWTQTHRNGGTQELGSRGFSVDSDGSLKMHDPSTGKTSIYRLDGSTEIVHPSGRVEYTDVSQSLERNRLRGHVDRFGEGQRSRFVTMMDEFEMRAAKDGLTADEVGMAYHHLNRILQAGDTAMLSESHRLRLSEMIMHHLAHPTRIDQGMYPTCNVTVLEKRMYARNPSEAVRLLADVASSGRYVTASGATIDLSSVPAALAPDQQAKRILDHRFSLPNIEDLEQDNVRTWASQIFENTAVNIKWLGDSRFRRSADDVVIYEHTAGNNDGRIVRYSVDYNGNRIREELQDISYKSGKMEVIDGPQVYASELNRVYNEISGGADNRFVLIGPHVSASHLDIQVHTQQDFEAALADLASRRDFPAVAMVNTNNNVFSSGGIDPSDMHSWHVINIQNAYFDRSRKTWMVEFTNQWGRSHDRMGENAVTAKDLFDATVGPHGRHGRVLASTAAMAPGNVAEGAQTLHDKLSSQYKGKQFFFFTGMDRQDRNLRADRLSYFSQ